MHKFTVDGIDYAIVATDATPNPGVRRPYNFFGVLTQSTLDQFQITDEELKRDGVQMAIWAGHYPATTIFVGGTVSSQRRFFEGKILQHGAVYLCGHLHTMHDAEFALYARHPPLGQLELELADFQRSQRFRVLAVDHGLLSFVDVPLRQWPIILITNPKEAIYAMPNHEPLEKIMLSSHVRVLVFSPSPIRYVTVKIDGYVLGNATKSETLPVLYTCPWSPMQLKSSKFHSIQVEAVDMDNNLQIVTHTFFIDVSAASLLPTNIGGPIASLTLLSNVPKICRNSFIIASLALIFVLLLSRCSPRFSSKVLFFVPTSIQRGLNIFASIPSSPFLLYLSTIAYPVFGPWFLGQVVTDRYALVFPHGMLLFDDFTTLPDAVVAVQGLVDSLTFFYPVTFYFCWMCSMPQIARRKWSRLLQRVFFQFFILWQIWEAYCDAVSYGAIAFWLNPIHLWIPAILVFLDFRVRRYNATGK